MSSKMPSSYRLSKAHNMSIHHVTAIRGCRIVCSASLSQTPLHLPIPRALLLCSHISLKTTLAGQFLLVVGTLMCFIILLLWFHCGFIKNHNKREFINILALPLRIASISRFRHWSAAAVIRRNEVRRTAQSQGFLFGNFMQHSSHKNHANIMRNGVSYTIRYKCFHMIWSVRGMETWTK